MATRSLQTVPLPNVKTQSVKWTGLANGDDGAPVRMENWPDKSVQVVGTFGTGGSVNIEGSIDGTNYAVLTDPQGNALTFTATKIEAISELVGYIRPRVTAGDGTTSLAVHIIMGGRGV